MKSKVQLLPFQSILWNQPRASSKIVYAFQGKTVEVSRSKNIRRLIKALNAGQNCLISDYLTGKKKLEEMEVLQLLLVHS